MSLISLTSASCKLRLRTLVFTVYWSCKYWFNTSFGRFSEQYGIEIPNNTLCCTLVSLKKLFELAGTELYVSLCLVGVVDTSNYLLVNQTSIFNHHFFQKCLSFEFTLVDLALELTDGTWYTSGSQGRPLNQIVVTSTTNTTNSSTPDKEKGWYKMNPAWCVKTFKEKRKPWSCMWIPSRPSSISWLDVRRKFSLF